MNDLLLYFIGLAAVIQFHVAWTRTTFSVHLWNLTHPKDAPLFTTDSLVMASLRYGAWGDLWLCATCAGFWFSLAVGGLLTLFAGSWWVALVGAATWTGLASVAVGSKAATPARPYHPDINMGALVPPPASNSVTVLPEPTEKAKAIVLQMLAEMRASTDKTGALTRIHPRFAYLKNLLDHPVNEASRKINVMYRKAREDMESGNCSACDQGALIRQCLALLYDAGFHELPAAQVSGPSDAAPK